MNSYLKVCGIILILELALLTVFSSADYVLRVMAVEGVNIEDTLGTETLREIDRGASESFNALFVDSGAYAGVWHTFIPTPDERNASEGIENLASGLFAWMDDRLTVIMVLAFQVLERLQLMKMWLPFSFVLLAGACYTGLTLRRIKQGNFAYASPTVHRMALRIIIFMLTLLPLFLMLPMPVSPYVYPALYAVTAFLIQAILANIAKRI